MSSARSLGRDCRWISCSRATWIATKPLEKWLKWQCDKNITCDKETESQTQSIQDCDMTSFAIRVKVLATRKEERILETAKMRRMKGVTLQDRERSESIRRILGVRNIPRKVRESRLRWFGHVARMREDNEVKRTMLKEIPGRRGQTKNKVEGPCQERPREA